MGTPVFTGTNQPVRQPDRIHFDPARGQFREITYKAAKPEMLVATANGMLANRWIYEFDQSIPSTLRGTASGNEAGQPEITTDNWQVLPNELQIHLFQMPGPRQLEIDYPGALRQILRKLRDIDSDSDGTVTVATLNWNNPVVAGAALTASKLYLDRLMREETHKADWQWVLYHTTSVSQNDTRNVADSHVGQIYTTAQMLAECRDGSLWTYPLPARLVTKIGTIPTPAVIAGYTIGWRKLPAKESTSAENRIEIASEFWFGQWDTLVKYDPYA